MKVTKEEIRSLIKQCVQRYTKAAIADNDRHLLCDDYHIMIPDFLYVFRDLEKNLGVPVVSILEKRDYTVFTINNLTNAIAEDYPEILSE